MFNSLNNIIGQLSQVKILYNTAWEYVFAGLVFLGVIILLKIFQLIILTRLVKLAGKSKNDIDNAVVEIFRKIGSAFYFIVALFIALRRLSFPGIVEKIIYILFLVAVVYEIVRAVERVVSFLANRYFEKNANVDARAQTEATVRTLQILIRVALWLVGAMLIMSNLGVNVTSLIASLGIGGIAVALALQNILSDLFSAFSIYIDKPFEVGDFIVVGTERGTVEKIGLKTTRIRSLSGEQIVISNQELTSARIQNFKRLQKRREVSNLGVTYNTPAKKLAKIPEMVREIVETQGKMVAFDRCHFSTFGDSSLNFELAYFINSSEYKDYMDIKEKINLAIFEKFAKEKIEFAYPTQTVYVKK